MANYHYTLGKLYSEIMTSSTGKPASVASNGYIASFSSVDTVPEYITKYATVTGIGVGILRRSTRNSTYEFGINVAGVHRSWGGSSKGNAGFNADWRGWDDGQVSYTGVKEIGFYINGATNGGIQFIDRTIYIQYNAQGTVLSNLSPVNKTIYRDVANTFSWTAEVPPGATLSSQYIVWRTKGSANWNYISVDVNAREYSMPIGKLPLGNIEWKIQVTDSVDNTIISSAYDIATTNQFTVSGTSPLDGAIISTDSTNTFTWRYSLADGSLLSTLTLYYKQSTSSNYNSLGLNASTQYTFGVNTFGVGAINWYLRLVDNHNNVAQTPVYTVTTKKTLAITPTSPVSGNTIYRLYTNTFKWNRAWASTTSVKSQTLYWKYDGESNYRNVPVDKNASEYSFAGSYFNNGKIQWYMVIVDANNNSAQSSIQTVKIGATLKPSISSPTTYDRIPRSTENRFKWSPASAQGDYSTINAQYIVWKATTASEWNWQAVMPDASVYTFAANTFPNGTIEYYIYTSDSAGNTGTSVTQTIYVGYTPTIEVSDPLDGARISSSQATIFSWNEAIQYGSIEGHAFYWKQSTASTYTKVTLTANDLNYKLPGGSASNGTIQYYVEVTGDGGNKATTPVITVNVGITPSVEIGYPDGVNVKGNILQIFTWNLVEDIETGQKSYELGYRKVGTTTYTKVTATTADTYKSFAANTFETTDYEWYIKVTNNDNLTSTETFSTFKIIGLTEAPVITNVTNSAIPTFTWEIDSQDTFELEIWQGTERLYASGICVGDEVRSYTPNIMLEDGNYSVKMVAMNEYGYFTEWMEYSFVIKATKPTAIECYAYATDDYAVGVTTATNATVATVTNAKVQSALYVIRRELNSNEDYQIIGKIENGKPFIDRTCQNGITYEYALRYYKGDAGYADSDPDRLTLTYSGFILYDDSNMINIFRSEEDTFGVAHQPTKTFSYANAIGRTYPVKESSEWMTHEASINCFVTIEQYKVLEKMYKQSGDLWYKDKDFTFQASINSLAIVNALINTGYTVSLSISRTDEEEVKLF